MSETPAKKYTFVVYAPDYSDPECLARRLSVRESHLANAAKLKAAGLLKIGGALITPDTYTSDVRKMAGSLMIFETESIEATRELIESDIYYTSNVWDKEKLSIGPFASAHPL